MKTYKQPPPWPNDPQQWDTRHDIRRFLEDALSQSAELYRTLEELRSMNVIDSNTMLDIIDISEEIYKIYNGEEED